MKLVADEYARIGNFRVLVPDIFDGERCIKCVRLRLKCLLDRQETVYLFIISRLSLRFTLNPRRVRKISKTHLPMLDLG